MREGKSRLFNVREGGFRNVMLGWGGGQDWVRSPPPAGAGCHGGSLVAEEPHEAPIPPILLDLIMLPATSKYVVLDCNIFRYF